MLNGSTLAALSQGAWRGIPEKHFTKDAKPGVGRNVV